MASSLPLEIAETIQTASIKQEPSVEHDLNPSTAASKKTPVELSTSQSSYDALDDEEEEEDIPYSVLKPAPRRPTGPPLPDLRFEQSYLASIAGANGSWLKIAGITIRDQVCMPLAQGLLWSLIPFAWRHWNRNAELSGSSTGAKIRRWWYRTNNWKIPEKLADKKIAEQMGDFYKNQSSND